jgi:hypothetical protein
MRLQDERLDEVIAMSCVQLHCMQWAFSDACGDKAFSNGQEGTHQQVRLVT